MQMKTWESSDKCPSTSTKCTTLPCGEKCGYKYIQYRDSSIVAIHQTPRGFIDDLTMDLEDNGPGCSVAASSSSRTWYAVLDYATNYCNLRNIVDGAGISTIDGFSEVTSDSICT